MRIYRIELADGTGPYVGGVSPASFWYESARHPTPLDDPALGFRQSHQDDGWRFGFASPEQMRFWFYREEWRRELEEMGYMLSVYECEQAQYSDAQAIFHPNYAKLIERVPLD